MIDQALEASVTHGGKDMFRARAITSSTNHDEERRGKETGQRQSRGRAKVKQPQSKDNAERARSEM